MLAQSKFRLTEDIFVQANTWEPVARLLNLAARAKQADRERRVILELSTTNTSPTTKHCKKQTDL